MAFLDKKERILDVVLTDKGRDLLSRGELNFSFYAFSDSGVDYKYFLNSASYDDKQYRSFLPFEADQRKNRDLQDFLYTMPATTNILPKMKLSITGNIDLTRIYETMTIPLAVQKLNTLGSSIGSNPVLVFRGQTTINQALRDDLYVVMQKKLGNSASQLGKTSQITMTLGNSIGKILNGL